MSSEKKTFFAFPSVIEFCASQRFLPPAPLKVASRDSSFVKAGAGGGKVLEFCGRRSDGCVGVGESR